MTEAVISAVAPATRYSLRTRAPEGLPAILRSAPFGGGTALGLGPDEWLLILPQGAPAPDIAALHALTEISDRNVALLVTGGGGGGGAAAVVQTGCPIDLRLAAFPVGKATRTVFEGVEIVLWRTGDDAFHIEVWRSFHEYLRAALDLAAADWATA